MAKKKNEPTLSPASVLPRSAVLAKCKKDVLEIFRLAEVTMPEAFFMFDEIKHSALKGVDIANAQLAQKAKAEQNAGNMFG